MARCVVCRPVAVRVGRCEGYGGFKSIQPPTHLAYLHSFSLFPLPLSPFVLLLTYNFYSTRISIYLSMSLYQPPSSLLLPFITSFSSLLINYLPLLLSVFVCPYNTFLPPSFSPLSLRLLHYLLLLLLYFSTFLRPYNTPLTPSSSPLCS